MDQFLGEAEKKVDRNGPQDQLADVQDLPDLLLYVLAQIQELFQRLENVEDCLLLFAQPPPQGPVARDFQDQLPKQKQ